MAFILDLNVPKTCRYCHFGQAYTDTRIMCHIIHMMLDVKKGADRRPDFCPIIPINREEIPKAKAED